MELPGEACKILIEQFGVIGRWQLLRWVGAGQIEGWVQRGALVPVERGVYRAHGGAIPEEQAAMAAVLRVRDARIAGPLLLGLFGAEGFGRTDPFVVLARAGRRPRNVEFPVSADPCRGRHLARWGGLPVMTPTMACIDLAHPRRRVRAEPLRVAVDSLRWAGRTSTPRLRDGVAELPSHLGARRLRRMLDDLTLVSESEKERILGTILDSICPRPVRQGHVGASRVDFLWALFRLIVEYDGEVHDRPDRRVRDTERDRQLEATGHRVVHLRRADLDDPVALRARLVRALRTRAVGLGLDATMIG